MAVKKDTKTSDLFELPEETVYPGSMDYRKEVSHIFSIIIDEFTGDRYELAARISRLSGVDISKQMLDGYTAEARKKFNVPFWLIVATEEAANSRRFTNWLVKKRAGRVFYGKDVIKAEIGSEELKRQKAASKIKELSKGIA